MERGFIADGTPPATVETGLRISVVVRLRNTGSATWEAGRPIGLAYHWLDEAGSPVVWDGNRTALPLPVEPGHEISVTASVVAPIKPGRYGFQWDMVEEQVCWFSQKMASPPPVVPVQVEDGGKKWSFSVRGGRPLVFLSGSLRRVRVTVRNTGSSAWEAGRQIRLAYHWLDPNGRMLVRDGLRTELPLPVPPGGEVTVSARLSAPRRSGLLQLQWDVSEEGVRWFSSGMGEPPASTDVLVVRGWRLGLQVLFLIILVVGVILGPRAREAAGVAAVADLLWLAASLFFKQGWVLWEAGPLPRVGSQLVALSAVMVPIVLLLLLPQRARPWVAFGVGCVMSLLLWGDVLYMRYFQDLPSLVLLQAAKQTGQVTESIRALMHASDVWLLLDLFPAVLLVQRVARIRPARFVRAVAAVVCALALVPGVGWAIRSTVHRKGGEVQRFSALITAKRVGVVGFHLLDAWGQVKEALWGASISDHEKEGVRALLAARRSFRSGSGPLFGTLEGRNVILLQVESLQGFMVGLRIDGQEVTPTLDRLASRSVYLTHCTDQTAYGRTSDAELLTEVSLLPASHGAACFRHGGNDFIGLADVLAERGYTTLSAVPFEGGFWNRRLTHPAFGFAANLFDRDFGPGRRIGWGLNDRDFLAQMLPRLDELHRPFLAYMITLSLHHPFEGFPSDLEELDVGRWEGTPFGGYIHAMHFFDKALAGFLKGLRERGLADSTLLVVWGDHDAGFPWRPELAKAMGMHHKEFDWIMSDRVPLLIVFPEGSGPGPTRLDTPVGLWDVPPTVAALLGVDPGPLPWLGRNLAVAADAGPVVRPRGGWIDSRLLFTGDETRRCYDWHSEKLVPVEECAEGTRRTRRIEAANDLILKGDLQPELVARPETLP